MLTTSSAKCLWATPEKVLRGAYQAAQLHHRGSALLIITAAWTGCRWGELAALQRHNTHPDDLDDLEIVTVEYIDWYNNRCLHGEPGHVPPAEYEALHAMTHPVTATLETS